MAEIERLSLRVEPRLLCRRQQLASPGRRDANPSVFGSGSPSGSGFGKRPRRLDPFWHHRAPRYRSARRWSPPLARRLCAHPARPEPTCTHLCPPGGPLKPGERVFVPLTPGNKLGAPVPQNFPRRSARLDKNRGTPSTLSFPFDRPSTLLVSSTFATLCFQSPLYPPFPSLLSIRGRAFFSGLFSRVLV